VNQIHDLRQALALENARLAPRPGIEGRVVARVLSRPRTSKADRQPWVRGLPAQALRLAAGAVILAVLVSMVVLGRLVRDSGSQGNPGSLTTAEQAEVAQLEARPLALPPLPADGSCPVGPYTEIRPWLPGSTAALYRSPMLVFGNGPIYGYHGRTIVTAKATYHDVDIYSDPSLRGPALIRAQTLDGPFKVVYTGRFAAGAVVGTDVIEGKLVQLHSEMVLPANQPPSDGPTAPGWGFWKVRHGVGTGAASCYGFQVDTLAGTEIFVVLA